MDGWSSCLTLSHFKLLFIYFYFFFNWHTLTHKHWKVASLSEFGWPLIENREQVHLCPVPWLILPRSAVHICLSALACTQGGNLLVLSSTPFAVDVPGCRVMDELLKNASVSNIYSLICCHSLRALVNYFFTEVLFFILADLISPLREIFKVSRFMFIIQKWITTLSYCSAHLSTERYSIIWSISFPKMSKTIRPF